MYIVLLNFHLFQQWWGRFLL